MSAAEIELVRVPLRCDRWAPGLARDAVKRLDAVAPVRDDAVLLVSELVSTAVMSCGMDPRETIEVVARERPQAFHIVVSASTDDMPARDPEPTVAQIVGMLARRWGIEREASRVELWAELALN
jgi:hypothetical protein